MRHPSRRALGLTLAATVGLGAGAAGVALANVPPPTPLPVNFVTLEPSGLDPISFRTCTGLGSSTDVVETRTETGEPLLGPGRTGPVEVVCTRPTSTELSVEAWRKLVLARDPRPAFRDTIVTTYDANRRPGAVWTLRRAWPREVQHAQRTGGLTETVTFVADAHERRS